MIFYGTNASRLKDGRLNNVTCPNCKEHTSMTYSVFGKYAYIYWIPFFPLGKTNVLECNNCKKTFKLKELPEQIKHKFQLEKHTGIPYKHFTGLAIIGIIIASTAFFNAKNKEKEAEYVKAPQINDMYRTEGSKASWYTIAKVSNVRKDSVYLIFNDYEVDKKSGIKDIDIPANYNEEFKEAYSIEDLQQLYKDDIIYQIDRD